MERYNYYKAVYDDVLEYIKNNVDFSEFNDLDDIAETLRDDLWTEDSVTGNASGSYTFSTWKAEENLCHNLDLLEEALDSFGCGPEYMTKNGPEACDVTIRCYLLDQVIYEILEEYDTGDLFQEDKEEV